MLCCVVLLFSGCVWVFSVVQCCHHHDGCLRCPVALFMLGCTCCSFVCRCSVLELWKNDLRHVNERAAEALADPEKYPNLFPDLEWALQVESIYKAGRGTVVHASSYLKARDELDLNLIELVKNAAAGNKMSKEEAEEVVVDVQESEAAVSIEEPAAESEVQEAEVIVEAEAEPEVAPEPEVVASALASPVKVSTTPVVTPASPVTAVPVASAPVSPTPNPVNTSSVEEDDLDALIAHADDLLIDDEGAGEVGAGEDIDIDDLGEDESWE